MKRRDFLITFAAGTAGSIAMPLADRSFALVLSPGSTVSLRCLSSTPGPRYLDGRTQDGTVGLALVRRKPFIGTQWEIVRAGEGIIALRCVGNLPGPRWLDGRTGNGTVGLAPNTSPSFSGTRWKVILADANNPNIVALQCLGTVKGPQWLDGRPGSETVGLAPTTVAPFTGTRWEVQRYPVCIDEPC